MSNFNIFENNWLDTVFEGRNKNYGAYKLRKEQSRTMFKAFLIGTAIFCGLVSIPIISNAFSKPVNPGGVIAILHDPKSLTMEPKEKDKEELIIPPKMQAKKKPRTSVVKYTTPRPVDENEHETVDMLTQQDLKNVTIGREFIDGADDGDIIITEDPTTNTPVEKDIEVTEGEVIIPLKNVQVKPEPKGGLPNFYKYIAQNYNAPDIGSQTLKVLVSFIVDIDGNLIDLKVIRDMGYGTGEEALRVLKSAGKWNPGIQNGKPVKVSYILPISIRLY